MAKSNHVIVFSMILGLSALFLIPSTSFATIESITDCVAIVTCEIVENPPSLIQKNPDNGTLSVWDEVQNYTLEAPLRVDRVFDENASFITKISNTEFEIATGTIVSSHYVQWDNLTDDPLVQPLHRVTATLNFDSQIFAFITDDANLFVSDDILGLPDTDYDDFPLRSLESGDATTFGGNQVEIAWAASNPGDWARLITAFSPAAEPATLTIIKNTIGGNESFTFDVTNRDSPADSFSVPITTIGGTGSDIVELDNDVSYTVTENAPLPIGWTNTSLHCTQNDIPITNDFTTSPGDEIVCTFYNAFDADNDGFTAIDDCNDADASINPGATEICNAIDDDCNALVDDNLPLIPTGCGIGACQAIGMMECIDGTLINDCSPGIPAANDAMCNAIDDDCDGLVDEDYTPVETTCGEGACSAAGITSCVAGNVFDNCTAGTPAASDAICNAIDDDCDGSVDEDYVPVQTTCGVGQCSGNTGFEVCQDGSISDTCNPTLGATEEICDAIDNNCDGTIDDEINMCTMQCQPNGTYDINTVSCVCDSGYIGDFCEIPDSDNDGVPDAVDQCPGGDDNVDENNNGIPDACDNVATSGKVTAGGAQLDKSTNFGFNVMSKDAENFKGQIQYNDKSEGIKLHSQEITLLSVDLDANTAYIEGIAKDGSMFTITVEDNGEPGKNDFFSITIGDSYEKEGTLSKGNIQIHS